MERTERFRPYGTRTRARAVEHENAVPGSSTLVLNPTLHVGSPTPEPTGGKSETLADAENTYNNAEGNEAAVSSFYRSCPLHAIERSFDVRSQSGFQTAGELPARVAPSSSGMGPGSSLGHKSKRA